MMWKQKVINTLINMNIYMFGPQADCVTGQQGSFTFNIGDNCVTV